MRLALAIGLGFALSVGSPAAALAQSLPFNANPNQLVAQRTIDAVVKTIGIMFDEKDYEPATPLGKGLTFGLEATLSKVPQELSDALVAQGLGAVSIPVLPVLRAHVVKGIGFGDFGFGLFWLPRNYSIWCYSFKVPVYRPSEGPTYAVRLSYTESKIQYIRTKTWTPQFLVSRDLEYADPYIGIGYQYVTGGIDYTVQLPAPLPAQEIIVDGRGRDFFAFTGVQFKFPQAGLMLVLEGSYSHFGAHALGTKVGFTF